MSDLRREKEEIRLQRARIDQQILALLQERARLSKSWAAQHPEQSPTLPSTERGTLDELAQAAAPDLPEAAARSIFREIQTSCRALEAPMRVAFVGLEGGYGWAAARGQFGPLAGVIVAESVPIAIGHVLHERADFAVLPFESVAEGPSPSTLLALKDTDLKITALYEVDTQLAILSREATLDTVTKVYATPQDRAAAEALVAEVLPKALLVDVRSPLQASQLAAEDPGSAALGHESAGKTHDLMVLARTGHTSRVRYCVVTRRPASRTGKDATALLFTAGDEPGALFQVLEHFAQRDVNLRKIHSWPSQGDGWDYLFFLEVTGHVTDRQVTTALEGVKKQTKTLRVLGSYPT